MAVKFLNGIDVDGSMNIAASDVPNLDASKITSGTFSADRIPTGLYQPAGDYLDLETANTTFQPIGNYLTSVPSEYLTQTEGDARYLQSLPSHNHDALYDAIGSAAAVQTFVNEQNFATDAAISTAVSNYLPLSGGTLSGNLTVGAVGKTSDTVVRSLADQSYKAGFEAYGNGQGTGYVYVGQSLDYGGGFSYNGDNSPGFISGETADNITFFRRQAGTNTEVFHYAYSNNDVYFNGAVVASGSNSNNWNTAYGWGNHASAGYLTIGQEVPSQPSWENATQFYSEGDIAFSGAGNHSLQVVADNGNDAFMAFHIHGDHAVYLGLENGTNRLYTGGWSLGSAKYQIWDSRDFASTNVSNWNTAYGWGNHASVGYLTSLPSHNHDTLYDSLGSANAVNARIDEEVIPAINDLGNAIPTNNNQLTNGAGYATTSYVNTAVSNLVASAPAALDTLNELAAALGDDANFSTTIANNIGAVNTRIDTEVLPAIDTKQNAGNYATFANNIYLSNSATTENFITELTNLGAFQDNYKAFKVAWSYAGNSNLDVGFESVELAGCLIECWGGTYKHVRLTRPTTGTGGRSIYVYNDQGSSYAPGWRQIWTSDEFSSTNVSNWNTAYGWGNHASAGYLTSIPSTYATDAEVNTAVGAIDNRINDEVIPYIDAVAGDAAKGVTAYSWGNHAGLYLGATAKAADSNLLDGIDSSAFLRSNANDSASGNITFSGTITHTGNLVVQGTSPTMSFLDTNAEHDFYIHVNSNNFYVLRNTNTAEDLVGTGWDSPHPMQIESDTNSVFFFGNKLNSAAYAATTAFDSAGSAAAVSTALNERIDTEVFGAIGDVAGTIPTNNNQLTNGAGYITAVPSSFTTTNITATGYIKGGGQQLVLSAGEAQNYATGQTAEYIYMNAEQGIEINSDTGNWAGGWAARKTAYLRGDQLTLDGETLTKTNIQNFKTAYGWGNHASAGYLTSIPSTYATDAEVGTAVGVVDARINDEVIPYIDVVAADASKGAVAHGWGDHSAAGYLTSLPAHNHDGSYDPIGSADAVALQVNTRIDQEVIPSIPTNNNQLLNGAGYITAVPSSFSTNSITIGNGVTLSESTDRADLLMIKSSTSTWAGLQVSNTSNEFIFSLMGDGNVGGIYDDQNGDWIIYWSENAGVELKHNTNTKLNTTSTGVSITGALVASGDVTAFSDARVKENVETISNALDSVKQMRGVTYNKIGEEKQSVGVIAQELEEVVPQLVHTDEEGMKSVAYGNITAVLIEALKEQQAQIEELKARLDGLTK